MSNTGTAQTEPTDRDIGKWGTLARVLLGAGFVVATFSIGVKWHDAAIGLVAFPVAVSLAATGAPSRASQSTGDPPIEAAATGSLLAQSGGDASPAPEPPAAGADSDGDGVPDVRDRCMETLPGATGSDASGCPTEIDPYAGLIFDHDDHKEWYERYWTGECGGLSWLQWLKCTKSDDYWHRIVAIVLDKVPPAERGRLRFELWGLGRLVGHEWAKDNDVRKISTDDVSVWGEQLRAAANVGAEIAEVRARAEEKLR